MPLPYVVQFVDRITATPTVRLDIAATWIVQRDSDLSPPTLDRAYAGSMLVDGRPVTAASYGNRTIVLALKLRDESATEDQAAAAVQVLARELNRPGNVLRWQPGTTQPVYFRTLRAEFGRLYWDAVTKQCTAQIPAEPFAYGLKVTLPAATVYNDPARAGSALNTNPYFETNALGWAAAGGTFARSTAQFHQGAASGLLTPDGVTALVYTRTDSLPVTVGATYRGQMWVRCAASRSVDLTIDWYDAGAGFLSQAAVGTAVAANTWTLLDVSGIAPVNAVTGQFKVAMGSTPAGSHLLYVDEATIGMVGAVDANGMFFDLAGSALLGDVETPLFLTFTAPDVTSSGRRISALGVRRRGTPSAARHLLQAESMTPLTGTTLQANDSAMSGAASNFMRVATFTGSPCLVAAPHPVTAGVDVRGTYRVFARIRKGTSGDGITLQLQAGVSPYIISGERIATLPTGTTIRWVDLGLLQIPLGADPVVDGYSGVALSAEGLNLHLLPLRVSGSGHLDIDCVLLIPADDRFALIKWPEDAGPVSLVADAANAQIYAVGTAGQVYPTAAAELAGALPVVSPGQDTRVYFLLDVGDTSVFGDDRTETTVVTPYFWPRYLFVRGAA